jgi:hypothetical protein
MIQTEQGLYYIKNILQDIFYKYTNISYNSTFSTLDYNQWTFSNIRENKEMDFNQYQLYITIKLGSFEEYSNLFDASFKEEIDKVFTDRDVTFDNNSLEVNMYIGIKLRDNY